MLHHLFKILKILPHAESTLTLPAPEDTRRAYLQNPASPHQARGSAKINSDFVIEIASEMRGGSGNFLNAN
ncbi:hypothetical protein J3D56_000064 [Erwinia persicina]|uniref:Uncharacterized protein n=2 Tax=Erwinia TaxID=551 RepID=A0ABV4E2E6_9GAMM|nr:MULTISPECIES: hypothetical protein [Erwinia]MCP1436628.1 hypothetical protein [Erwinia persicina]MDN4628640.1 hypothetical protein [Erwinia sp. PsM31]MDN8540018.1 hypothetical protein [Erwinia sp. BC051422]